MFFLPLLILCLFHNRAQCNPCPQDFEHFQDKCYAFGDSMVTWGDAEEICRAAGGVLAEIKTSSVNTFLKNEAHQRNGGDYWVGATDVFHEGVWIWITSGELFSFTDWHTGEPNDATNEDCMALWQNVGYLWVDDACSQTHKFICEREPEETIVG